MITHRSICRPDLIHPLPNLVVPLSTRHRAKLSRGLFCNEFTTAMQAGLLYLKIATHYQSFNEHS